MFDLFKYVYVHVWVVS